MNLPPVRENHLEPGADRSAIRFLPDELDIDPAVAVPRIREQRVRIRVARHGASGMQKNVLITVIIEVREVTKCTRLRPTFW